MKKTLYIYIVLIVIVLSSFFIACPNEPTSGDGGDPGNEYTLTVNIDPDENIGSVDLDPLPNNDGKYEANTEVTLTATATDSAYKFVKWYGNVSGVTTNSEITIIMNSDKMVVAQFSDDSTPPDPVTNIITTPGWQEVKLEWDDPSNTDLSHINVTWSPDTPATPTPVPAGGETITINGLENDIEYTFTLTSVDNAYNESTSATAIETPHLDPPSVPTNVYASPGYNLTIKVSWDDVPDADYYVVRFVQNAYEVPDTGTPGEDFGEIIVNDGDSEELFWVDLDEDDTADIDSIGEYFAFRVQAVNEAGSSDFSPNSHPTTDDTYAYIGYVYRINIAEDDTASVAVEPDQKSYYNTNPYDTILLTPTAGTNGGIWSGWSNIDYADENLTDNQNGTWSFIMDESLTLTANYPIPQPLTVDSGTDESSSVSNDDAYDIWYFDVTEGNEYCIYWDDNSLAGGSGTYTGDVSVAVYDESWTPYWGVDTPYADYGYNMEQTVTIPAGQTKVYVRVKPLSLQWNSDNWGDYGIQIMDVSAPDLDLKDPDSTNLANDDTYTHPIQVDASNGVITEFTFTIENNGTAQLDYQNTAPDFITEDTDTFGMFDINPQPTTNPLPVGTSDTFKVTFTGNGTNTGTQSATYSINTNDPNDNPFTFTIQVDAQLPYSEVNVKTPDGSSIDATGSSYFDGGVIDANTGAVTEFTFTIENLGVDSVLNLTEASPYVTLGGTYTSMFQVTTLPSSSINPGDSTTFVLTFTGDGTEGIIDVPITILNDETGINTGIGDETDEQSYNFSLMFTADLTVNMIDDFNTYSAITDLTSTGPWTAFDTNTNSWAFVTSTDGDPVLDNVFAYGDGGNQSLRLGGEKESEGTGGLGYEEISFVEIDIDFGTLTQATLEFRFFTSTDSGSLFGDGDWLKIWVDEDNSDTVESSETWEVSSGSGLSTIWELASETIGDGSTQLGTKKIRIYYEKDYPASDYDDVVWIDHIYWYE